MVMATGKGGGEREGKGIERTTFSIQKLSVASCILSTYLASCKALNRTSDLGTKHIATQGYLLKEAETMY